MIYIGIDSGVTGAISIIHGSVLYEYGVVDFHDSPAPDDLVGMLNIITDIYDEYKQLGEMVSFWVEKPHAMPQNGSIGSFKLARSFGLWLGLITGVFYTDAVINYVTPQAWKKHFGLIKKDKKASLELARRLFPEAQSWLKRVKDHNRAEALLLAAYGRDAFLREK